MIRVKELFGEITITPIEEKDLAKGRVCVTTVVLKKVKNQISHLQIIGT